MIIISTKHTKKTSELMKQTLPPELAELDVVINLGNSNYNLEEGMEVVNSVEGIRNSVDKKKMFELFIQNEITTLNYFDLDDTNHFFRLISNLEECGCNGVVLRDWNPKRFKRVYHPDARLKDWYTYATAIEDKLMEYRVIVFKNKIIRTIAKLNLTNDFRLKQFNSRFIGVPKREFPVEVLKMCKKAVSCLGLDLGGVDLMLTRTGEWKVIEVNSGMGMNKRTLGKLYNRMKKVWRV